MQYMISRDYISLYPPYEFKDDKGFLKLTTGKQVIALIAWGLGILLLSFIEGYSLDSFQHDRIASIDTGKDYKRIMRLMNTTYSKILENYYHFTQMSVQILDILPLFN